MRKTGFLPAAFLMAVCAGTQARAQVSLTTVVDLTLSKSHKVEMAQADLDKARATVSETIDAYIPQVSTNGGYGKSTGAPLSVPQIFTFQAESLIFSFSQRDYIRAAKSGVESAEHALAETEIELSEDATNNYLALDNALQRRQVLKEEKEVATRLVNVVNDRIAAGVDANTESIKARRNSRQIDLQLLVLDDDISAYKAHLAALTGLPATTIVTDWESIPRFTKPVAPSQDGNDSVADSEGIKAAMAMAISKQHTAFGDHRYLFRPQIVLQAEYSRVDTGLSSYTDYYPRFNGVPGSPNSQNSLGFGLWISVPLLDMKHRAKERESAADARHAMAEALQQRALFAEGRAKLRNAAPELDARADMAELDHEMAQAQLDTVRVQLQPGAANLSGPQATPKDELNASLQERQKFYDYLSAQLQLHQTQVNLLRQEGGLGGWIHQAIGTSGIPITGPASNGVPGASPTIPLGGTTPASPITH